MATEDSQLRTIARFIKLGGGLAAAMVLSLVAASVHAQSAGQLILSYEFSPLAEHPRKTIQAIVALKPPEIDGIPDDACWAACAPQELGSEMGGAVSRSTFVRVCCDEKALYVAFVCQEPSVADLPAPPPPPKPGTPPVELPRDVRSADDVQVHLAFADKAEEQYRFAVGIAGARLESSLAGGIAWSPEWSARCARTAEGWTAELALPFAAFGSRRLSRGETWRVNFTRNISLSGERCSWEATCGNDANPAFWGDLTLGDTSAAPKREPVTRLSIFPARWTLRQDERTLRAVVRIEPGALDLANCKLRLRLPGDEKAGIAARETTVSAKGQLASLVLDAGLLPAGKSTLEAELVDAAGAAHGMTRIELRREVDAIPAVTQGRFDLVIPDYGVKTRLAASWPMSVGIVLPQGAVRDPANVRMLDEAGAEVPSRGTVRSRWPADGSIRWLTLDFPADLSRGERKITVEYGPEISAKPPTGFTRNIEVKYEEARNIYIAEKGGAWWVNTGALLFKVNQARFSGVEQTWVDVDKNGQYDFSEQILNGESGGGGPYLADSTGRLYRMASDPAFRMQLEEWNELRVVLRGEGRLAPVDAPGEADMGRCVFRLTAYAGQPFLRVQYTFYFNQRALAAPLNEVGVVEKMDFDFRKRADALFGIPDGFRGSLKDLGVLFMLVPRAGTFAIQNLKEPRTVDVRGTDPQEWGCASAPNRGVVLCLRDMGSRCPKGFEINPDGRFTVHFWPPYGDDRLRSATGEVTRYTVGRLDFAHSGRRLDLAVPLSSTLGLKDQDGLPDYGAVRDMSLADPAGVAATYDVLYYFYGGAPDPAEISAVCNLFDKSPHAVQSRESLAAAGELAGMLPPEKAMRSAELAKRLLSLEEARGAAEGDFNFQDVRRTWLPNEQRWKLEDYWLGTTGDRPGALWTVYMQTGRPDVLLAAQRATRHMMDADICHEATPAMSAQADPRRRKIKGGFGGHHTPVHWQAAWHVSDRVARIRALLLSYYLAGDLLARDTALEWAAAARDSGIPFAGQDGMVFLDNISALLALDYDASLMEKLGECADYFFRMPAMLDDAGPWTPGLGQYKRQTGDPRESDYLRRAAPSVPRDDMRFLCLLRDIAQAAADPELEEQIGALTGAYEDRVDKILASPLSKDEPLTWEDFCSYVFGATVPASSLAPAAPVSPPAAAPVK